jgi:hypothetical protein
MPGMPCAGFVLPGPYELIVPFSLLRRAIKIASSPRQFSKAHAKVRGLYISCSTF